MKSPYPIGKPLFVATKARQLVLALQQKQYHPWSEKHFLTECFICTPLTSIVIQLHSLCCDLLITGGNKCLWVKDQISFKIGLTKWSLMISSKQQLKSYKGYQSTVRLAQFWPSHLTFIPISKSYAYFLVHSRTISALERYEIEILWVLQTSNSRTVQPDEAVILGCGWQGKVVGVEQL